MISQKECIERFIKTFPNNEYNYSRVIYRGQQKPVEIYCNACKKWFMQKPEYHWKGHGCKICGRKKANEKEKLSKEEFLRRAKEKHGDKYKYINLNFKSTQDYIEYICLNCGKNNKQKVCEHLKHGCSCNKRLSQQEILERFKKIHKNKYNYSLVVYTGIMDKIKIICNKHNKIFEQIVLNHLNGSGCPKCNQSSGELIIENILKEKNILAERNKKYKNLIDLRELSYDFFLPKYNLLIEYNGKQHYDTVNWSGKMTFEEQTKELKNQRHHDWLKRKYAKKNNIKLLIIPYWEFDNIENILLKQLTF